jgi:hypothetical protein
MKFKDLMNEATIKGIEMLDDKDALQLLIDAIRKNGFKYAVVDYDRWNDIRDDKFHKVRDKYVAIDKEMKKVVKGIFKKYKLQDINLDIK